MTSLEDCHSWQDKVSWARAGRDASLAKVDPPLQGLPSDLPVNTQGLPKQVLAARELEITESYSVTELLAALRSRRFSVEEVTRAFLRRAALAQTATNCLTGLLWDEAIARAKELDALPEPRGSLFGLPISTKEHHGMIGDDAVTSASFVGWIGKKHACMKLYEILWDEGCVFFARTTQPQTIMHLETSSNVWGTTTNPYNRNLTPGGSSGGESALIGFRGSIFGIGGDIGGSIRCPAAHCGLYGFKYGSAVPPWPTSKLIPSAGQLAPMSGKETIMSTPGPLTVEREALDLFMKVVLQSKPWRIDPSLTVKGWTPYKFSSPLKIAVMWWDGVVQPHPPMTRALREVSEACRKAGFEVSDWDAESLDHKKGWDIISSLYFPDGGKEVLDLMESSGEPVLPLTKFIIQEQAGVKDYTQAEIWKLTREREEYRARYAEAWTRTGGKDGREIDVILCPPYFGAATPHEQARYWGYTSIWNLLDYPGAVFPVTTVDPAKDKKDTSYVPKNEQDQFVQDLYSPEVYTDAPVSLQLVGRRQHDEKVLAALAEVERAMGRP
ncbi:amidase [Geosmithia morbida]|uniref:amidase n=1 Tax=Geosmithia morbida TaxID=1094350 RepID=A0A9P4YYS0_9HYPO|nr:amidase [Geosmithia morbida]KAF4124510.1 amidase [Geosmithia morbida]